MKRFLVFLLLGLAWALPAHAALYAEFNPDTAQGWSVGPSETVEEIFLPLNDFLGGFDFWVSDAGTATETTFALVSPAGTVLGTRTVTVPAIADSDTGTRFHVDLSSQVGVNPTGAYHITVTPTARITLYEADVTRLLAQNAAIPSAYSSGVARIGGQDQLFSFTHALYEYHETAPPVLSNVSAAQTATDTVIITFNANEPVDRSVVYGSTTIPLSGAYTTCPAGLQSCTVALTVQSATTYTYTLTARDVWGNQTTYTGSFTTAGASQTPTPTPTPTATATVSATPTPTPDTTAPVITNARIASSTAHSATIAWTTNEAANGIVVVQTLPYLISAGANSDSTLELEHAVTVSGLPADTFLRATITSSDAVGNSSKKTVDFTTPRETSSPTPAPSSSPGASATPAPSSPTPSPTPAVSGPQDNQQLTWSPPASGDPSTGYRIDIFDSANVLIKTIVVPPGQRSVALGALPLGNNRVIVYANNNGVYEKVAAPTTVAVRPPSSLAEKAVTALPYALGGIVIVIFGTVIALKRRKPAVPIAPPTDQSSNITSAP